jgi:hypothetical protein
MCISNFKNFIAENSEVKEIVFGNEESNIFKPHYECANFCFDKAIKTKNQNSLKRHYVFGKSNGKSKNQRFLGNPDIFGPQLDCGWCGGGGCGHCSD